MSSPTLAVGGAMPTPGTPAIGSLSGTALAGELGGLAQVPKLKWRRLRRAAVILSLVATSLAAGFALFAAYGVSRAELRWSEHLVSVESRVSAVRFAGTFQTERELWLNGIRDEIALVNPRLSREQSEEFAELLLSASEKYPSLDPLLILSVGIIESRFDPRARSPVNARGLYQIWPATGRRLAEWLGWAYDDELLYDPARNTELAAFYLDRLFKSYNDEKLVFAEYNGGPLNAGYYRAGSPKIAAETKDYVQKVSREYARLRSEFSPLRENRSLVFDSRAVSDEFVDSVRLSTDDDD